MMLTTIDGGAVLRATLCPTILLLLATGLEAQVRRGSFPALSPPTVTVAATPVFVTVTWLPVDGAASYAVETAPNPAGPWVALAFRKDLRAGSPTTGGPYDFGYGTLYYYRVTALAPVGPRGEASLVQPGVTVVPWVTPPLRRPLGVELRQDGADLRVSWSQVPYPHSPDGGYVVTVAPGQQLPATHTVQVGKSSTEARIVNVALPTAPKDVWVEVAAVYGPGARSLPAVAAATLVASQACWPAGFVPGPPPATHTVTPNGPTGFDIDNSQFLDVTRVERAPMGSQAWQSIGCSVQQMIYDWSLSFGTKYQYRITEITWSGAVGQRVVVVETPPAPDNPTPTATVSNCTATGCYVTLNWKRVAGAQDYRIESSYGLLWAPAFLYGNLGGGGPPPSSVGLSVPKGVHTFSVTPLFLLMRPSPKPPGRVTVVVP